MKRILLVAACIVCALVMAGPASAVTLGANDVIGWVVNGTPSDLTSEVNYSNSIIGLYTTSTPGPVACFGNNCYATNFGDFGALDPVSATGSVSVNPPFTFPVDLSGGSYEYVYAKFGGFGTLYFLGGATSLDGITLGVFPPGVDVGGGLSHYVFFNPTQVPEGGTLMLLGFGLAGVGTFRRFLKR